MKSNALKNYFSILLTACSLSFVGCTTDVYNPEPTPTPEPKPDGAVFDFATEKSFTLNVKYDVPEGYKVSFEVYTENPLEVSQYGQVSKKDIKPIDVGTTDEQGNYSYKITRVPAMVNQLYVYSPNVGVPHLMVANVNGDQLEDAKVADLTATKALMLRDASEYENTTYNQFEGFGNMPPHRLGYWQNVANQVYGRPLYLEKEKLVVNAETLNWINNIVPEGRRLPQLGEYLQQGDIKISKESEIWLYFLHEVTGAYSSLGYYCYETNNPPQNAQAILNRTVIAFPHAKKVGNEYGYGALNEGEGIQLHFVDANGVDQGTKFPAGISIGWVIYNNGYKNAAQKGSKLTANGNGSTPSVIYSTPSLRPNRNTPQVALFRKDQFVALTMEDWYSGSDWDYNDIIFSVNANPIQAILPDIPEAPDPENPVAPVAAEYEGVLAFEDLWPRQGDFDMNDVVVHYKTKIGYNENNEITTTEDTFTLSWSGATFHNGFGYLLKTSPENVTIESSKPVKVERDVNTGYTIVRLFSDALGETENNTKTPEITIATTFKKPLAKNSIDLAPYNPFITPMSLTDKEVHLTNNVPTSFANAKEFGTVDDQSVYGQGIYYVTHQRDANGNFTAQQLPFAIHMLGLEKGKYVCNPAFESKRIDTFYPKFLNWVNTSGKEDTDWFLHPKVK